MPPSEALKSWGCGAGVGLGVTPVGVWGGGGGGVMRVTLVVDVGRYRIPEPGQGILKPIPSK